MQEADFELERQQADEELARLLGELVVEPIDRQLEERMRGELFCFGEELDSKLRKQLAALSKSRDLERHFESFGEGLEGLERKLQQQSAGLSEQLSGIGHEQVSRGEFLKAGLDALNQQLGTARQVLVAGSRQLQVSISEQLQQQGVVLEEKLGGLGQAQAERIEALQVLVRQLAAAQQAGSRQWQADIVQRLQQQEDALCAQQTSSEQAQAVRAEALQSALNQQAQAQARKVQEGLQTLLTQLGDKLDAAQAGMLGAEQQATRSLLAELKRQAAEQQTQLQSSHAELAGMLGSLQALPSALTGLQGQTAGELQQVQGLVQQQQAVLASQQLEIQQLHRALRGFAWAGMSLGVIGCAGLALLALHTPAIRALLGLPG